MWFGVGVTFKYLYVMGSAKNKKETLSLYPAIVKNAFDIRCICMSTDYYTIW